MTKTFIIGGSGHGREVLWLLNQCNRVAGCYDLQGFVDDDERLHGNEICGVPVVGPIEMLASHPGANVVLGVGMPEVKRKILSRLSDLPLNWPALVAPDVQCSDHVDIERGAQICSGSILTSKIRVGEFSLVNVDCTVAHDVEIAAGTTLSPGVHLPGHVSVGSYSNLGTGAVAIPGVDIGDQSVVGAGAVVIDDVPAGATVVGNPARIVERRDVIGGRGGADRRLF